MVVFHKFAITSVISLGRFVFLKLSLISKWLIISSSDKVCSADILDSKATFCLLVIPGRFFTLNDEVDVTGRRISESPSKVASSWAE